MRANHRQSLWWLVALLAVFSSAVPGLVASARAEGGLEARRETTGSPSESLRGAAGPAGAPAGTQVATATPSPVPEPIVQDALEGEAVESQDYDPWEPFNERMFSFNRQLDRYVVKPAATGWDTVLPDEAQQALGRAFDNLGMPRRFLNSLLQLKIDGSGRELARFLLNSTIGMAGFFDVAREAGLEASDEDTGQTLAVYGVAPGPYLVLPFLPPLTVRDGIGFAVDGALNPLSYVAPFAANAGMKASDTVNARSLNLELFEDVEESTLDLYSAVRNGYLQRRDKAIRE